MQNKYVGDIGDYCKLGLLRWLLGTHSETGQCKFSLGVCWYAVTNTFDPPQNRDGRHIDYLGLKNIGDGQIVEHMDSAQLSHLDPALSSVRLKIKQNQLVIWWQRNASGGVWLQGA